MPLTNITGAVTNVVGTVSDVTGASHISVMVNGAYKYIFFNEHHNFVGGVLYVFVGFFVARWIGRIVSRAFERQNMDPPVRSLLTRLTRLFVLGLALTAALEVAGFQVTALLTGFGVLGVGIGFGMQGLVSNMTAGLTIIFTKPFRVGDYVEVLKVQGTVRHVDLVSTTLTHVDGSTIVIPNHKIIGDIVHNFGTVRQIILPVGVAYGADLKLAQQVILETLNANSRVLRDPKPLVMIGALQDSAITINGIAWVKLPDYGPCQSELSQALVERLRENQIEIPFPQREIRILNAPAPPESPLHEFGNAK
ncbi:MAG TPA: mechanosensitive ion channel domain-containing protein [Verrucomicrobiae bacterium]|jgi:small conductance mechanosensitive channel|nr:mechanosensitive ion channel domain-containing protein [Verrucomicrobiae bacterium]